MSHTENKVNWCLKKALKEIEEGKKHRGLIKVKEDKEKAKKHIEKAMHNLSAIEYFDRGRFSDWSMSAVFYCIYHCFLAITSRFGYESKNQECTIVLIKHLKEQKTIELDDRFIKALEIDEKERHETSIIEKREFYTYGTTSSVNKEEIQKSIQLCKDCLDQAKDIISK